MKIYIKFIETKCSRHWAGHQWSDGTKDAGVDLGETFTWVEWWSWFVAGWFVMFDLFAFFDCLKNIWEYYLRILWFRALRTQGKIPWEIEPSIVLVEYKHLIVQDRRQLPWHVPWLNHRVRLHTSCMFERCLVRQRRLRRWKMKVSFLKIWFWEIKKNCLGFIS